MTMFIGLGAGALLVGVVAFMAFGGSKTSGQKVTLDDVVEPGEPEKSEESSAKKKKKSKKSEAATSSANMEGPIDKDALFKAIDQGGPYSRTISGTLEPESVIKFHRIT